MKIRNIIHNRIFRIALGTGAILIVPLSFRWPWTRSDFIVMGTILFISGLILNLVIIRVGKYKVPAIVVIVLLFLWLWAELAVGLFTNWGS